MVLLKSVLIVLMLFFLPICTHAIENKSSFDCSEADLWLEKKVCSNTSLSQVDLEVAALYQKLKSILPDGEQKLLDEDHRRWKKENRECQKRIEQWLDASGNDYRGYGESDTSWCLEDSYRWRKVTLTIALDNQAYAQIRKKECGYGGGQEYLRCLVEDLPSKNISPFKEHEVLVYEYPFNGTGTSMLLPGDEGKTLIVDIGDQLLPASEVVFMSRLHQQPMLVTKTRYLSGARLDGCVHYGKGHCQERHTYHVEVLSRTIPTLHIPLEHGYTAVTEIAGVFFEDGDIRFDTLQFHHEDISFTYNVDIRLGSNKPTHYHEAKITLSHGKWITLVNTKVKTD